VTPRGLCTGDRILAIVAATTLAAGVALLANGDGFSARVYQEVVFTFLPQVGWGLLFVGAGGFALVTGMIAWFTDTAVQRRSLMLLLSALALAVASALWALWLLIGWGRGVTGLTAPMPWIALSAVVVSVVRLPEVHR
jgi:hypothetical protein